MRHIEVGSVRKALEIQRALRKGAVFERIGKEWTLDKASIGRGFEMKPSPTEASSLGRRALTLKPGRSAIVRRGGRYHVIQHIGRTGGSSVPFKEAAAQIRKELEAKAVSGGQAKYIRGLMEKYNAAITLNPDVRDWEAVVAKYGARVVRMGDLADGMIEKIGAENLRTFALRCLVRQEAAKRKVGVSKEELRKAVDKEALTRMEMEARRTGARSVEELRKRYKRQGKDLDEVRADMVSELPSLLEVNLLAERCLRKILKVTPEEIEEEHKQRYDAKVKARQIVGPKEENLDKVVAALDGGAEFADIARRFSLDRSSARRGGVLEVRNVGLLGRTLFRMKVGERRKIRIGRLWHLVEKLADIPAKNVPLDKTREELRKAIMDRKVRNRRNLWIMDLETDGSIELLLK